MASRIMNSKQISKQLGDLMSRFMVGKQVVGKQVVGRRKLSRTSTETEIYGCHGILGLAALLGNRHAKYRIGMLLFNSLFKKYDNLISFGIKCVKIATSDPTCVDAMMQYGIWMDPDTEQIPGVEKSRDTTIEYYGCAFDMIYSLYKKDKKYGKRIPRGSDHHNRAVRNMYNLILNIDKKYHKSASKRLEQLFTDCPSLKMETCFINYIINSGIPDDVLTSGLKLDIIRSMSRRIDYLDGVRMGNEDGEE